MKVPKELKEAIQNLNFPVVDSYFKKQNDDKLLIYISDDFFKSNSVLFKRQCKKVSQRDLFVKGLIKLLDNRNLSDESNAIKLQHENIIYIESKYFEMLTSMQSTLINKEPNEIHCWAHINRAEKQIVDLISKAEKEFLDLSNQTETPEIRFSHVMLFKDDSSHELINLDAVVESIVKALSSSLLMLGFTKNWFNQQDKLVIPTEVCVSDEHIIQVVSTELLAFSWAKLEESEQYYRYFGGNVSELSGDNLPEELNETGIKTICKIEKSDDLLTWLMFEFVAHERINRIIMQDSLNIATKFNLKDIIIKSLDSNNSFSGGYFVSEDEAIASSVLSSIFSFNIEDDSTLYNGLTITEWVRGYSVIKRLVIDNEKMNGNFKLVIESKELAQKLVQCGFSREKSEKFIQAASFGKDSRDLFDCPIINMTDGKLCLMWLSLVPSNTALIVLSRFSSLSLKIEKKGECFEENISKFLLDNTGCCKSFKFKRNAEEYEYDAVAVWGKFVFVVECKNTSLSHGNPIASYYYLKSLEDYIKQVKRLVGGLKKHPEVFSEHFNQNINDYKIVPIVLNSLPFSIPGDVDGVIVTDASSLKRFFEFGSINCVKTEGRDKNAKVSRSPVYKLWQGDTPTPLDLIIALRDSFQYKSIAVSAGVISPPVVQFSNSTILWREIIGYTNPPIDSKSPLSD